jgi:GT2 family glycosyltransferase
MKVNIILLDYDRHQFTEEVKRVNFNNAGHEFDHIIVDMQGISKALNHGIRQSFTYDAIVTMANDILMPDGWLNAMVTAAKIIPNTGMCGIHCVEGLGNVQDINGVKVHPSFTSFGNVLIPMSAIRVVGGFNEAYHPYGMDDADMAYRLNKTGHINYYLHGLSATHLGHDVGQPSDYRRMKDEGLSKAGNIYGEACKRYDEEGYNINNLEWPL